MKRMFKRIFATILGVALLISMIVFNASCKKCEDYPTQPPQPESEPMVTVVGELIYQYSDGSYYDEDGNYCSGLPYYTVLGLSSNDVNGAANKIVIPGVVDGTLVRAIADGAFYGNDNITTVEIPSTVSQIGESAFAACRSLASIEVASESTYFKSVDGNLYSKDGSVLVKYAQGKSESSFTVDAKVEKICGYAFNNANLTNITLSDNLTSIGDYAFAGSSVEEIIIPAGVEELSGNAFTDCASLTNIEVMTGNQSFKSINGNLYAMNNGETIFIRYAAGKNEKEFTIGGGTTVIGAGAFAGVSSLESITLLSSVKTIEDGAFLRCASLKSMVIPLSVVSIDPGAFDGCISLASFTVNGSNNNYSASSGVLLSKDSSTIIKYPAAKTDSKYTIPSKVTRIGDRAFADACNLVNLELSAKVEYIGVDAFENCEKLTYNSSSGANYLGYSANKKYALISLNDSYSNKSFTVDSKTKLIAGGALADNKYVENVHLPSVEYICENAFAYCASLKYLDLSGAVTLYSGAVAHCSALNEILLGTSIKLIEENAITDCPVIKSVFLKSTSAEAWENLSVEQNKQDCISYNSAIRYYFSANKPAEIGNYWHYETKNGKDVPVIWGETSNLVASSGLEMTLSEDRKCYTVTGSGSFTGAQLVIPAEYQGKPVIAIGGGAFADNTKITSLVVPYSVLSIGADAFVGCSSLTTVSIDNSVTSIGTGAFRDCVKLASIDMPDKLTSIEAETFYNCKALNSVSLPENLAVINESAFHNCVAITEITLPYGVMSIANNVFYGCSKLEKVTLPETLNEIGNNAFTASGITTIDIPESVTWISESAFVGCESLSAVNVVEENIEYTSVNGVLYREKDNNAVILIYCPDGYYYPKKSINDKSAEVELIIPDTVTAIADYAVANCINLRHVHFGSGIEVIGSYAFADTTALNIVNLPESLKSIKDYAFNRSALVQLNIAEGSAVSIGAGAFSECEGLVSVTMPDGCTAIGMRAFYGCKKLRSITIPDSVNELGMLAFYNCEKLGEATIGDGITKIADGLFGDCISLKTVIIGNSVSEIAYNAFDNCTALDNISVASDNASYYSAGGVLFTIDKKTLVRYPAGLTGEEFEIPSTITTIADGAFTDSVVKKVVFNDTLEVIGNYAFAYCKSLTSVTIGANVGTIGKQAFRGCVSLESLEFADSSLALTIGDEAFYNCTALGAIVIPDRVTDIGIGAFKNCRLITSVVIGNGVTEIKKEAFSGADDLGWLVLGTGVAVIGENAFDGCNDLESVYCLGDKEGYAAIDIAKGNLDFCYAARYYYSADDPGSNLIHWHYAEDGSIVLW